MKFTVKELKEAIDRVNSKKKRLNEDARWLNSTPIEKIQDNKKYIMVQIYEGDIKSKIVTGSDIKNFVLKFMKSFIDSHKQEKGENKVLNWKVLIQEFKNEAFNDEYQFKFYPL